MPLGFVITVIAVGLLGTAALFGIAALVRYLDDRMDRK